MAFDEDMPEDASFHRCLEHIKKRMAGNSSKLCDAELYFFLLEIVESTAKFGLAIHFHTACSSVLGRLEAETDWNEIAFANYVRNDLCKKTRRRACIMLILSVVVTVLLMQCFWFC